MAAVRSSIPICTTLAGRLGILSNPVFSKGIEVWQNQAVRQQVQAQFQGLPTRVKVVLAQRHRPGAAAARPGAAPMA